MTRPTGAGGLERSCPTSTVVMHGCGQSPRPAGLSPHLSRAAGSLRAIGASGTASSKKSGLERVGSQPFSQPQCPHLSTGGAGEGATVGAPFGTWGAGAESPSSLSPEPRHNACHAPATSSSSGTFPGRAVWYPLSYLAEVGASAQHSRRAVHPPCHAVLPFGARAMSPGSSCRTFFTDIASLAHPFCIWLQNLLSGFLGNQ